MEVHRAGGAVAVLCHDAFGGVGGVLPVVITLPVEEHDDICVLLNGAAFPQIAEHGTLVFPLFIGAGELTEADHRHTQVFGHDLQRTAQFADLLDPVLIAASAGCHQLEIVDDDQPQIVQAAAFRLHLCRRDHGVVVDADVHRGEDLAGGEHILPVAVVQLAGHQLLGIHKALG